MAEAMDWMTTWRPAGERCPPVRGVSLEWNLGIIWCNSVWSLRSYSKQTPRYPIWCDVLVTPSIDWIEVHNWISVPLLHYQRFVPINQLSRFLSKIIKDLWEGFCGSYFGLFIIKHHLQFVGSQFTPWGNLREKGAPHCTEVMVQIEENLPTVPFNGLRGFQFIPLSIMQHMYLLASVSLFGYRRKAAGVGIPLENPCVSSSLLIIEGLL